MHSPDHGGGFNYNPTRQRGASVEYKIDSHLIMTQLIAFRMMSISNQHFPLADASGEDALALSTLTISTCRLMCATAGLPNSGESSASSILIIWVDDVLKHDNGVRYRYLRP